MDKGQKEEWILERFLELYSKKLKKPYKKLVKRISHSEAPGPDFIIKDNQDNKEGVEVTELLDWPSYKEGQQRVLEDEFERYFYKMLNNDKYRSYSFVFYRVVYPSNKGMLKKHVEEIVKKIDLFYQKGELKDKMKFVVNNQKIRVLYNSAEIDGPSFVFFLYGEEGINASDRESFFKGLKQRIGEKIPKSKKYVKDHSLHLVIYDNTRYSIFINDIQKEIYEELGKVDKGDFEYIWLLSNNQLFKIV
ncbi:MAG: hypothetical protein B6D56_01115 [Candidatus Omnitrophica bacterium 4484_70.1]|nr:MAG: hypothetical protein B6D56_01115 [Candidatus Omnitrophica bacterium 4484_70.1]